MSDERTIGHLYRALTACIGTVRVANAYPSYRPFSRIKVRNAT